jgi:error-prone DNA polymerase
MAQRDAPPNEWGSHGPAVRLGLATVRGIGEELAGEIVAGQPYADMEDLRRRVPQLTLPQLEALATAGTFELCFGLDRRASLWQAGAVAQSTPDRLAGVVTGAHAPPLPGMEPREESTADLWSTGVSAEGHPTLFVRDHLDALGVVTAAGLRDVDDAAKVLVGGVVTHRQRPATAQGTIFMNLEDETGFVNVVVSKGCWARYRRAARSAPAVLVRGRVEKASGVINVVAERIETMPLGAPTRSRDFR